MSHPAASPLAAHLGYWLRAVSNQVSHSFARKLEAEAVTVAEWAVLRQLYDAEPLAPSRLAEAMGLSRGAISKLAERLRAKGLLRREADATDGRAQILALAPAGAALVPRLAALADANDAEFFADLPAADRLALQRILRAIVDRHALRAVPVD